MKIAILSDIHGNYIALNAVLNQLKENDISKIVVAGDHISDCPSPSRVIDKLIEIDAIAIKGNREKYILDYMASGSRDWEQFDQMYSLEWTRSILTNNDLQWIKGLKDQESLKFPDKNSIRIVHGSPDSVIEHLYKDKQERLSEVLSSIEEDVLICGHSHLPWSCRIGNKLAVNAGSVGVSFNKNISADYVILTWEKNQWHASHHSAVYSFNELYNSFKESGLYEEGGIWGKLILQSLKDGKNRNIEFIKMTMETLNREYKDTPRFIPNNIWRESVRNWDFDFNRLNI